MDTKPKLGTIKILGCGTSTGVPVPGCKCAICLSPDPKNKRDRTSAALFLESGKNILIDTSADLRHQALRWGLDRIDAVLYTHSHADHIMGLDDLRAFNFVSKSTIPCFADADTLKSLKRIFSYVFERDPDYEGGFIAELSLHEIEAGQTFTAADVEVECFLLRHGRGKILGYRIGDFAYATDCNLIPDSTKQLLAGVKNLVLDGLRIEPHRTHFSIPEAVKVATEMGIPKTYLTHMTHTVDFETISRTLPSHVELAYDGLEIPVTSL